MSEPPAPYVDRITFRFREPRLEEGSLAKPAPPASSQILWSPSPSIIFLRRMLLVARSLRAALRPALNR